MAARVILGVVLSWLVLGKKGICERNENRNFR